MSLKPVSSMAVTLRFIAFLLLTGIYETVSSKILEQSILS